jgi:hypothetical protein
MVSIDAIRIDKDEETQVVIGHASFIKTVEDLYECMTESVPGVKFGLAFAEASGPCLIRSDGNNDELIALARKNMAALAAGHSFIVLFKGAYPINVVNAIKSISEVQVVHCATSNPVEVIIAGTEQGNGILGVIDGRTPNGFESREDEEARHALLRKLGYKR